MFASWLWALSPGLTLGIGTAPVMLWAAAKKRSVLQALFGTLYLTATIVALVTAGPGDANNWFSASVSVLFFGGLAHGVIARKWVFTDNPQPAVDAGPSQPIESELASRQRAALEASRDEAAARESAREIVESDPVLALRLQIGRIDLPSRNYPDGGLIDVNNVPVSVLVEHLGWSETTAQRVVAARTEASGFSSVADFSVLTELPPQVFDTSADLLVFLPYRQVI